MARSTLHLRQLPILPVDNEVGLSVTQFKRIPIDLVVVDSGPLISLALAGRLDLLKVFRQPIRVLDVAKAECVRFRDKPGANELAAWFVDEEARSYATIETPGHLKRYREAIAKEDAGDTSRPSEGIGDEAITWYVTNISTLEKDRNVLLVLMEDAEFGDGSLRSQNPEVTVLSTRAFLQTLQNYGLVESAEAVIAEIAANARKVAPFNADRPGQLGPGVRADWKVALTNVDDSADDAPDTPKV